MLALLEHGYKVTIIDNLDNSFEEAVSRTRELAGDKAGNMKFVQASTARGARRPSRSGALGSACLRGIGAAGAGRRPAGQPAGIPAWELPVPGGDQAPPRLPPQGDLRDLPALEKLFASEKWVDRGVEGMRLPHCTAAAAAAAGQLAACNSSAPRTSAERRTHVGRRWPGRRYDAVIHFAGRKYVNESVEDPLKYYQHNVLGALRAGDRAAGQAGRQGRGS